jgi:hypothetical protein
MTDLRIPPTATDVDADWISAAIHEGGAAAGATVTAFEAIPLVGVHGGLMGDITQLRLTWDQDDPTLPASVVLKVPTHMEDNRAFATMFGQYAAEHGFYTEVAPQTQVRVPRCWWAGTDGTGEGVALLLEDIGHLETVDPIVGLSLPRAELAVDQLAQLHSKWWGNPFLAQVDWLPASDVAAMQGYGAMCKASLPAFLEATTDVLSEADHDLCRRFIEHYDRLLPEYEGAEHPLDGTRTLLHRDFHLGNMFFDGDDPVVYDWGNVAAALGPYDFAYFMVNALTEEMCGEHGHALLARYRTGLAAGGVEIDDDEFDRLHKANALFCLIVPLLATGDGLASNENTDRILLATMSRLFAYLRMHNAAAVFDLV